MQDAGAIAGAAHARADNRTMSRTPASRAWSDRQHAHSGMPVACGRHAQDQHVIAVTRIGSSVALHRGVIVEHQRRSVCLRKRGSQADV